MKKLFILIILINCFCITAQKDSKKVLQIITTANLTDDDKKHFITDFLQEFNKNRQLKERFEVKNIYFLSATSKLPIKMIDERSIQSMDNVINEKFENEKEFKDALNREYIDKYEDLCKIYYSRGNLDIGNAVFDNMKDVFRWIKKNNKNNIFLIWNNGYESYKYSKEYIQKELQKDLFYKFKPVITKPYQENDVLRPYDNGYEIEFENVDLFNHYLIKIIKNPTPSEYSEKQVLIFEDCLKKLSKDSQELKNQKKDSSYALYKDFDNKLIFWISDDFLATKCEENQSGKITPVDPTCDCKFHCLYGHQFDLVIKGCVDGIEDKDIPSSIIKNFEFQCNKTKPISDFVIPKN